jgi:hypothetical protein
MARRACRGDVPDREYPEEFRIGKGDRCALVREPSGGEVESLRRSKIPGIARAASRSTDRVGPRAILPPVARRAPKS